MKRYLSTLLLFSCFLAPLHSDEQTITKVFGSSPPMNYLLYAINPDKMIGLNFDAKNINNSADAKLLKKSFLDLPVIGSFHGGGSSINIETLAKYNPDLILIWEDDFIADVVKEQLKKLNINSLTIPFREIESMPKSIKIAADAIGEHKRGEELSSYADERIVYIKSITKQNKPISYYYAEGNDGLATECDNSFHTVAIDFAGGKNVHKCTQSNVQGLERISFEKLLEYNPEFVIAQNKITYDAIMKNRMFKHLNAIKNNRVILIPNEPFNWIDRPPSFMRLMGMELIAQRFYPHYYKNDLIEQIKKFYKLFLDVELSDEDIKNIKGI